MVFTSRKHPFSLCLAATRRLFHSGVPRDLGRDPAKQVVGWQVDRSSSHLPASEFPCARRASRCGTVGGESEFRGPPALGECCTCEALVGRRTITHSFFGDQRARMRLEAPPGWLELALKIPPARHWAAWVSLNPLVRNAAIRPAHHHRTASRPVALLRGALWRAALSFEHPLHRGRNDVIAQRRPSSPLLALQQVKTCRLARRRVKGFERARARLKQRLGLGALGISSGVAPCHVRVCVVILCHAARIPHRRRLRVVLRSSYGMKAKLTAAVNRNPGSRTLCRRGRGAGLWICPLRSFGLRQYHGF